MIGSEMPVSFNFIAGVSSQIKSAVMLAALNSNGNTVIYEKNRSRDHTENILFNSDKVIKIKKGKKENYLKRSSNCWILQSDFSPDFIFFKVKDWLLISLSPARIT